MKFFQNLRLGLQITKDLPELTVSKFKNCEVQQEKTDPKFEQFVKRKYHGLLERRNKLNF